MRILLLLLCVFSSGLQFLQAAGFPLPERSELLRTNLNILVSSPSKKREYDAQRAYVLVGLRLYAFASLEVLKSVPGNTSKSATEAFNQVVELEKKRSGMAFRMQGFGDPGPLSNDLDLWVTKLNGKLNECDIYFANRTNDSLVKVEGKKARRSVVLVIHPSLLIKERPAVEREPGKTHKSDLAAIRAISMVGLSLVGDLTTVICLDEKQSPDQIQIHFEEQKDGAWSSKDCSPEVGMKVANYFKKAVQYSSWADGSDEKTMEMIVLTVFSEYTEKFLIKR